MAGPGDLFSMKLFVRTPIDHCGARLLGLRNVWSLKPSAGLIAYTFGPGAAKKCEKGVLSMAFLQFLMMWDLHFVGGISYDGCWIIQIQIHEKFCADGVGRSRESEMKFWAKRQRVNGDLNLNFRFRSVENFSLVSMWGTTTQHHHRFEYSHFKRHHVNVGSVGCVVRSSFCRRNRLQSSHNLSGALSTRLCFWHVFMTRESEKWFWFSVDLNSLRSRSSAVSKTGWVRLNFDEEIFRKASRVVFVKLSKIFGVLDVTHSGLSCNKIT